MEDGLEALSTKTGQCFDEMAGLEKRYSGFPGSPCISVGRLGLSGGPSPERRRITGTRLVFDIRVLRLIGLFIRAGVGVDGRFQKTAKGVCQGVPLSPLLANILLDYFHKELSGLLQVPLRGFL